MDIAMRHFMYQSIEILLHCGNVLIQNNSNYSTRSSKHTSPGSEFGGMCKVKCVSCWRKAPPETQVIEFCVRCTHLLFKTTIAMCSKFHVIHVRPTFVDLLLASTFLQQNSLTPSAQLLLFFNLRRSVRAKIRQREIARAVSTSRITPVQYKKDRLHVHEIAQFRLTINTTSKSRLAQKQ